MKNFTKKIWGQRIRSGLILLGASFLLLNQQTIMADGFGNTDSVSGAVCMQDVYNDFGQGGTLNCTAGDISLAQATNITILDDGCAFPGDTVEFTANFDVVVTANERHDVGIYFSLDGDPNGDGALTGACTVSTPAYGGAGFVDLDGNSDNTTNSNDFGYCSSDGGNSIASPTTPCDGGSPANGDAQCVTAIGAGATCQEFGDGVGITGDPLQDSCGDITNASNPLQPEVTLTVACVDTDADGQLDLPYCSSWRQPGGNELCLTPLAAYPGTVSKCNCDDGFGIPINVPGQIVVDKITVDANDNPLPGDPTSFDYSLTGTDEVVVPPAAITPVPFSLNDLADPFESSFLNSGTYQVTETLPGNWELASASCTSDNGTAGDTSDDITTTYTNGADIPLNSGEIITCTFTNRKLNSELALTKDMTNNADEDGNNLVTLGDTLTYTFVASNTGDTPLTNVTIVDPLPGLSALSCLPVQPATLAIGEAMTCTATYQVTAADVTAEVINNTATADSDETPPVDDPEDVPVVPNPDVVVDKVFIGNDDEDGSGTVTRADTLHYTITATNTGGTTETITVSDNLTNDVITCPDVAPGGACVLNVSYQVFHPWLENGSVENIGQACIDGSMPLICDFDEERVFINQPTNTALRVSDVQVSEAVGTAVVDVTLSQPSGSPVTVDYLTVDVSASVGSDYSLTSGTLTFNPGETSKSIIIPIINDADPEDAEVFNVTLSNAVNASATDTGVVTILDDDSVGGGACGDPGYDRMTERELFIWQDCAGDGTWYVRATSGGGSVLTYSGNLTTDQSFSNVVNFSVEASDTVNTSNPQVIAFNLTMGSVWHDGFNFQVPSGSTCLTLDTPPGITVKVGENRTPVSSAFNIETLGSCGGGGQPTLSIVDAQVSESAGTANIDVNLSQPSASTITVDYQTSDASAAAGSDYGQTSGTLTFNPGDTSKSVSVAIINDADPESSENFNVTLTNPANASIADDTGVVTIQDDDSLGGSACGDPVYDRMTERELFIWQDCAGDGTWYVRATSGGGSVLTYSGNLTTDQSFSNVANFSIEASDTVNTSNPQVIAFDLTMGSVWHDGFNFQVPSGNTCLTLDTPPGITVKVGANRTPVSSAFNIETLGSCGGGGQPTLSIGDAQVSEGAGTANVDVNLSQPSASTVTVDYQTNNASATAGSDYGQTSGTLTFNPGDTSKSVSIAIIDDADPESSENFNVQLSNPANTSIADATGVVTIQDNDSTGGSACGDPGFDSSTERELFIWQDCAGDGTWYIRATAGGGSVLNYTGNLTTNQSFSNVVNFSIESRDTVDTSNPQVIQFNFVLGSVWVDGFNFNVPTGNTCLTLNAPAGITVKVGENRTPVSSAFDIETLGACQ